MDRPNILYLHSHDTGRFIQPYGHAVPTPNLQRFAEQGLLFRQAYCGTPTCSPSRACLLTGQCAHQNGMVGLAHLGMRLKDYRHHLAWTMRDAGYDCVLSGASHVIPLDEDLTATLGYHRILHEETTGPYELAAASYFHEKHDRPWFMACGFQETHRSFGGIPWGNPDHTTPPPYLPDNPETRADMARFKTSANRLDRKMGRVLDALDESGHADNTLVIITTDHGIAFPRMKGHLYDHGIGVMLMLRGPGGFHGGRVSDALVSQIDLFPTICELAGILPPSRLEGHSLLPIAADPAATVTDAIFAEMNFHCSYEPIRCVRTARHKYIRRYDDRTDPVLCNTDDCASKNHWLQVGYPGVEAEELYDLEYDPNEARNLIADPTYATTLTNLRSRLQTWMEATDDPLLRGPVPPWPTALLLPPDARSPSEKKIPVSPNTPNSSPAEFP